MQPLGQKPAMERRVPGARDYLVLFTEAPTVTTGRAAAVAAGTEATAGRLAEMCGRIADLGLEAEVEGVATPTAFGMVAIRCTPRVAEAISDLEAIEAVLAD